MDIAFLLIGITLILASFMDALWTTFWVDNGAGPLASRLSSWTWHTLKRLIGSKHHVGLSLLGPVILFLTIMLWVVLLWAGWTLVFASDPSAVVASSSQGTPDWSGRIYFVGYSIFTLGNGEFKPNGDVWQLATSLMTGSGMFMVTLAITYTISVVGAVVQKRGLASQVTGIGKTAEELVIHGSNGHDLRPLDLSMNTIVSELSALTHQYKACPILEYFHPDSSEDSPAVALAILEDAFAIFCHGVPEGIRPNPVTVQSADLVDGIDFRKIDHVRRAHFPRHRDPRRNALHGDDRRRAHHVRAGGGAQADRTLGEHGHGIADPDPFGPQEKSPGPHHRGARSRRFDRSARPAGDFRGSAASAPARRNAVAAGRLFERPQDTARRLFGGPRDNRIVTTLCPGGKERMRRLMETVEAGRVDTSRLVTHHYPLEQIEEAYDLFAHQRDGVLKVAIKP